MIERVTKKKKWQQQRNVSWAKKKEREIYKFQIYDFEARSFFLKVSGLQQYATTASFQVEARRKNKGISALHAFSLLELTRPPPRRAPPTHRVGYTTARVRIG